MKTFLQYTLPGILLILLGFMAGAQDTFILGLTAFLCFFVAGIALIMEGRKRKNKHE